MINSVKPGKAKSRLGSHGFYPKILAVFTICFLSHSISLANTKVKKGEYLIIKRTDALEAPGGVQDDSSYQLRKNLGRHSYLVYDKSVPVGLNDDEVIDYNPGDRTCADWKARGIVEFCSPNFIVKTQAIPNDKEFNQLWGMNGTYGIDAQGAWDVTTGNDSVVVAVIDTGVDYNHQDLARNIWVNPYEIAGNGIDDDGNGYIDDVHGINAAAGNGNPMDDNIHGTHVAGTIGAAGNNGNGVVGVNWQTKIMALKFLGADGSGGLDSAIEAMNYMIAMKRKGVNVRVANNSWGGSEYSEVLEQAIADVRDAGIIFVAAAGNESNDNDLKPSYPASYDLSNVVSVAAIDKNGNMAGFSNYGLLKVNIAAPGADILSTVPGNSYRSLSGTSMATPHVAGALALLMSNEPALSFEQAILRVYESGAALPSLGGLIRSGRALNISRMVKNQISPLPSIDVMDPCQYSSSVIPFAGNLPNFNSTPVIQDDEFYYKTISLPFAFPFFDKQYQKLTISPNGIIYFGYEPEGMDFEIKNGRPHPSTFAPLFTDLAPRPNPYGVWVQKNSEEVIIHWYATHYRSQNSGWVKVWAVLKPTGELKSYVAFSDEDVRAKVMESAIVGVRNISNYSSTMEKLYNVPGINAAFNFHSGCHADRFQLTDFSVTGTYKNKASSKYATPKRPIRITVGGSSGSGNRGNIILNAKIGRQACEQSKLIDLASNQQKNVSAILPSLPRSITNFALSAQNHTKKFTVAGASAFSAASKNNRKRKAANVRISAKKLNKTCEKFFSSFN